MDSKTAKSVIDLLRSISRESRIVVVVIHQPSFALFELFDTVLFVDRGRVIYQGRTDQCVNYFTSVAAMSISTKGNPIDDIFERLQEQDSYHMIWDECDKKLYDTGKGLDEDLVEFEDIRPSYCVQFRILFVRAMWDNFGDKTKSRQRITKKLGIAIVAGLVFFDFSNQTSANIFVVSGAIFGMYFTIIQEPLLNALTQYPLTLPVIVSSPLLM